MFFLNIDVLTLAIYLIKGKAAAAQRVSLQHVCQIVKVQCILVCQIFIYRSHSYIKIHTTRNSVPARAAKSANI